MIKSAEAPRYTSYDVVIVGGAMMGSSVAWWLSRNSDFNGRVLVVERDPSYAHAATAHSNSCMRQQFSCEINIQISQFAAKFVNEFSTYFEAGSDIPEIATHPFGYMYLAGTTAGVRALKDNQSVQNVLGVATRLYDPGELAHDFPYLNTDDILLGSHNAHDEGYFDGGTMFEIWRRKAVQNAVEYINNEVVGLDRNGARITGLSLQTGEHISVGTVVNTAGTRAPQIAAMAGIKLPVEPRARYTYVFDAQHPLDQDLPLTVDPCGVHIRSDGQYYMAGSPPNGDDPARDPSDFYFDHELWEAKVWPAIAHRIPAFEAIKVMNAWVGHYDYNTLDQNAIIGPHPDVANLIFVNGFSGHGFQQAPAMGRGVSELIIHGGFETLDLSPLGWDRIIQDDGMVERAVI